VREHDHKSAQHKEEMDARVPFIEQRKDFASKILWQGHREIGVEQDNSNCRESPTNLQRAERGGYQIKIRRMRTLPPRIT
jgi:hypothetical protein